MSIDDRLRSAQKQQLEVVRAEVERRGVVAPADRGEDSRADLTGGRKLYLAAAAAIVVAIAGTLIAPILIGNPATSPTEPASQSPASTGTPVIESTTTSVSEPLLVPSSSISGAASSTSSPNSSVVGATTTTPAPSSTASNPSTTQAANSTTVSTVSAPSEPVPSDSVPSEPVPRDPVPSEPAPRDSVPSEPVPGSQLAYEAVASPVCPSGHRAPLERAELNYIGESQGWVSKERLTDEQDDPFYHTVWEPNFPGDVTVEVVLAEPVLATDIRIARVADVNFSAIVTVRVVDRTVLFPTSGAGIWQAHSFAEPTLVDRFTIRRNDVDANIAEVLVCVEDST